MANIRSDINFNEKHTTPDELVKAYTEQGVSLKGDHSIEDVELALSILAYNAGNVKRTQSQLSTLYNKNVSTDTLKKWRDDFFPKRYADIQRSMADDVLDSVAGKVTDVASRSVEATSRILDLVEEEVKSMETNPENRADLKDLAASARNTAAAGDLHIRNARLLRDKPTSITKVEGIDEALKELAREGIIDLPDDEVIDADPVE